MPAEGHVTFWLPPSGVNGRPVAASMYAMRSDVVALPVSAVDHERLDVRRGTGAGRDGREDAVSRIEHAAGDCLAGERHGRTDAGCGRDRREELVRVRERVRAGVDQLHLYRTGDEVDASAKQALLVERE
jgi:hypothetical protein